MSKIQQPVQAIKMTNVAIVRYKHGGKRFEIACYVMNWRNKIEKDLNEVLQSNFIFTNVSKGVTANNADLTAVFKTTDVQTIAVEILEKGDLQVSEKERAVDLESKFKDIAQIVTDKCINRETKRPFSIGMIERSMKELHFSVKPNRTTKQQALEVMKSLKAVLPIERAQMRLKIEIPIAIAKALRVKLLTLVHSVESDEYGAVNLEMIALIDPGAYRSVEEVLTTDSKGKATLEIQDLKVQELGDAQLESEEAAQEAKSLGVDKLAAHGGDKSDDEEQEHRLSSELASRMNKVRAFDDDDGEDHAPRKKKGGKMAADSDDDAPKSKAKKKSEDEPKAKKSKAKKAAAAPESDDDDVAKMIMAPKSKDKKKQQRKAAAAAALIARQGAAGSDDESDSEAPAKKKASQPKKQKKADSSSSESDSEEEEITAAKKASLAKKKAKESSSSSESESEDDAPRKPAAKASFKAAPAAAPAKAAAKSKPKKRRESDSEEEIKVPNQSQLDAEEREEREAAAQRKAAKSKPATKQKKAKAADDSD